MQDLFGVSFFAAILGGLGLLALLSGLWAYWSWRKVEREASADYAYRVKHKMLPKRLSKTDYEAIYRRVHFPRAPIYMSCGLAAMLVLTPLILTVLGVGLELAYNRSGQSRVIEPGFLVWQFFLYCGLLASWLMIASFTAKQYHKNTPKTLQQEIDLAVARRGINKPKPKPIWKEWLEWPR